MKTHICYIVSSLANEGPVNVMYNIIQYIDFNCFNVSIVTLVPEKSNSRIDDFKEFPIKIVQLGNSKKHILSLYKELKKTLRILSPQILHAHCFRSLVLMNLLPREYKRLYTVHIYPGLQQKIMQGKIKGGLIIYLSHFFTKKCDIAIGCAESVSELYKKHKGWSIPSIPNGCSLPVWERNDEEKVQLKNRLGLKEDLRYFIFVGRFSKEKNPDVLIEAFSSLNRKDIGLIMLGHGPMWEQLKCIATSSENIVLPGFTTSVYEYLKASDYYISTSDVEGLANTLLESMSVGLPSLLSDIPSHREVLANIEEENVCYIIRQQDSEDIKENISKILSVDTQSASKVLQTLYVSKYTAERMSISYQELYKKAMMG